MKRLVILIAIMLSGCGVHHHLPSVNQQLIIKDSTVVHTELVHVPLPSESYSVITKEKKSHLETSLAVSDAEIDSTGNLHHSIANKKDSIKFKVLYKDRYVYRDSLVKVEVPVEVEKIVEKKVIPTIYKWSLGFSIGFLVCVILFILKKFGLLRV